MIRTAVSLKQVAALAPRLRAAAAPFSSTVVRSSNADVVDLKAEQLTDKTTKYGGRTTVTLIPGDGIGVELAHAVQTVFQAANVPVDWERVDVSGESDSEKALKVAMESLRRNRIGLKGVLYTPVSRSGHTSFNVAIRKELDLFANTVICKNIPGYATRHSNVDIAIIRENTEGEYSGLEHQSSPGVVESLKVITRANSERIAKYAFDFALRNGRKKVTAIHKANIMKLGDGLFLKTCEEVAQKYKPAGISFDSMIVDNACMQLVSKPQQFDVMVMPNLYGNIISNCGSALVGGPGIAPGGNVGREYALFEPGARHMAKDIQGKNLANPTAMILAGCMMLRHIGLDDHARKISEAVYKVYLRGLVKTPDMGGKSSTTDFTLAVIANI